MQNQFIHLKEDAQKFCCVRKHSHVSLNKLKSLKVAQVKDEMDDDEDDGCEGVCDVAW